MKFIRLYMAIFLLVICCIANAQFCAQCGTTPCKLVAAQKGIKAVGPPSPCLDTQETIATAGMLSQLMRSANADIKNMQREIDYWMLGKTPLKIFNSGNQMTENPRDMADPNTIEGWQAGGKKEIRWKIIRDTFVNSVGTLPFVGAKLISTVDSLNTLKNGDKDYEKRTERLFKIFEKDANELTGQPVKRNPDKCSPAEEESPETLGTHIVASQDTLAAAKTLRDKMLLAVLYGYNNAGLYHQAREFYNLASSRWGAVTDPEIRSQVNKEISLAINQTQAAIQDLQGGDPSSKGKRCMLESGKTTIINFKVTKKPNGVSFSGLSVNVTPSNPDADPNNGFYFSLTPTGPDMIKATLKAIHISTRFPFYPDDFNSIKLQFFTPSERAFLSSSEDKMLTAGVKISINGQDLATLDIPLPNQSRIVGPDGKWGPPPHASTQAFNIDSNIMGDAAYSMAVQFSDRPNPSR